MTDKMSAPVVHISDVLIIGGAASGLTAAVTAKETDPHVDVLVVDKSAASKGWAGKGARTAGLLSYVSKDCDPEQFIQYCLNEIGGFLNEQHLLREMAYSGERIISNLVRWGVQFNRDENGTIACGKWPFGWVTAGIDPDFCRTLSTHAKNLGVRFSDRIVVTELLKDGNRVAGACGFGLHTGEFHVFYANAVILACGSQNFDITPCWNSTGSAQAMAFCAGAEMRNVEFGCMGDFARKDPRGWYYYGGHGGAHTGHDHLHNKDGANISQKWRPGFHSSYDPDAANAWYQETITGNGPIMVDMRSFYSEEGKDYFKFHPKALKRQTRIQAIAEYPFDNEYFEVIPGVISELSCIRVNAQMASTVPGLYAVGDASGMGSARGGAVPTPPAKIHGTGLLNAFFMGMKGGPSAVTFANAAKAMDFCFRAEADAMDAIRERMFAPLTRRDGIEPHELIRRIQEAMAPCDYVAVKTEERMNEALSMVLAAKQDLPLLRANDLHALSKCVDAQAMVLCAEMYYRASLMRTESRAFQLREDYPERDDANWLKWIIVKKEGDGMVISTEPLPMEQYAYRP